MKRILLLLATTISVLLANPINPVDRIYIEEFQIISAEEWAVELSSEVSFFELLDYCSLYVSHDTVVTDSSPCSRIQLDSTQLFEERFLIKNEHLSDDFIAGKKFIVFTKWGSKRVTEVGTVEVDEYSAEYSYIMGQNGFQNTKNGYLKTTQITLGEPNPPFTLTLQANLVDEDKNPIVNTQVQEEYYLFDFYEGVTHHVDTLLPDSEGLISLTRSPGLFGYLSLWPFISNPDSGTKWGPDYTKSYEPGDTMHIGEIQFQTGGSASVNKQKIFRVNIISRKLLGDALHLAFNLKDMQAEELSVALLSPNGKVVAQRKIINRGAGTYSAIFDGIASGIYLFSVQIGDVSVSQKVTL